MCVVSMVSDHQINKWGEWINQENLYTPIIVKNVDTKQLEVKIENLTAQFEELRRDFTDFKKLVLRAIDYDERNNEPECEVEDKVRLIKEMANHLGIDVSDIWSKDK